MDEIDKITSDINSELESLRPELEAAKRTFAKAEANKVKTATSNLGFLPDEVERQNRQFEKLLEIEDYLKEEIEEFHGLRGSIVSLLKYVSGINISLNMLDDDQRGIKVNLFNCHRAFGQVEECITLIRMLKPWKAEEWKLLKEHFEKEGKDIEKAYSTARMYWDDVHLRPVEHQETTRCLFKIDAEIADIRNKIEALEERKERLGINDAALDFEREIERKRREDGIGDG